MSPKSKLAAWRALQSEYVDRKRSRATEVRRLALQRKHELEKEILKIDILPDNEGRRALLRKLREELERPSLRFI